MQSAPEVGPTSYEAIAHVILNHHLVHQAVPTEAEHEQLENRRVQEGRIFHQATLVLHHLETLLFFFFFLSFIDDASTFSSGSSERTEVIWNPAKQISPVLMTNCPKARTFIILSSASAYLQTDCSV